MVTSGPEVLDEVKVCSDFEKNFEVSPGVLNLSCIDPNPTPPPPGGL